MPLHLGKAWFAIGSFFLHPRVHKFIVRVSVPAFTDASRRRRVHTSEQAGVTREMHPADMLLVNVYRAQSRPCRQTGSHSSALDLATDTRQSHSMRD